MIGGNFYRKIWRILHLLVTILLGVFFTLVIAFVFWQIAGKTYLHLSFPAGGDFYNFYTYAVFFHKFLTLPPFGWMHWWNEGTAIVTGYPYIHYYLIYPLYQYFDTFTAVQIYNLILLFFFFLTSFLLFWLVSRSLLLSVMLIGVLFITKAIYYPLFVGGFIAAANTQWLLPAVFLFLMLFIEKKEQRHLVLSALFAGISILFHQPTSMLLIIPTGVIVLVFFVRGILGKIRSIMIFLSVALLSGSTALEYLLGQMFLGHGYSGKCTSVLCWGVYPEHLVYFNVLEAILPAVFILFAIFLKIVTKKLRLLYIVSFVVILSLPVAYCVASYFKLVDSVSGSFFPRRVYWAISFFSLLLAASSFRAIRDTFPKLSMGVLLATGVIIYGVYSIDPTILNIKVHGDRPDTYPTTIEQYVIPKYQKYDASVLLPAWFPKNEQNYRFHSFNQNLIFWWNVAFPMPAVLGFSNTPLGSHENWQYFLQTSLSSNQPATANNEIVRNRAQFLLDAYAIGFVENSSFMRIDNRIILDPTLVVRTGGPWYFSEFSKKSITPIISATNVPAVLFIGDDIGYGNFIRVCALSNLNSHIIIPVKGYESIDNLTTDDLEHFRTLILYRFKGNNWGKILGFVRGGGRVFIETGDSFSSFNERLPEVFPIETEIEDKTGSRRWIGTESTVFDTKTKLFSDLEYNDKSWGRMTATRDVLRSWAKSLLTQDGKIIMAMGDVGKGRVVWSGWNLPYHIVSKDNLEEATLFANILQDITTARVNSVAKFSIQRDRPEKIEVSAENVTGIYFKENYHSGWSAQFEGKKLKLYPAGLDFMYFPLSKNPATGSALITFTGGVLNWILFIVSISTTVLSLFYYIFPRPFYAIGMIINKIFAHTTKKAVHIWTKEEEY